MIRYLRDEVPLGTFMKRTIANAAGACWSICDGIANDIPTVEAIPVEWIRRYTEENRLHQSDDFDFYIIDMIADWKDETRE